MNLVKESMALLSKFFSRTNDPHGFKQECKDLMRGIAGGLIFGMPLLYTMEVWFEALIFSSGMLISILLFTLNLNILFSYFAGLREGHSSERVIYAVDDGVTSLGLSIILSSGVLGLMNLIDLEAGFQQALSKILLEASVISIGVTFTNFKFKSKSGSSNESPKLADTRSLLRTTAERQVQKDLNDLLASAAGAFVYCFNVAPTEEILLIASSLTSLNLILILLVEIGMCYIVLYASGLRTHIIYEGESFYQKPLSEVIMTVSISLLLAILLMSTIGFGELQITDPIFIPTVIVLGFPAVIGGAAGRLVV